MFRWLLICVMLVALAKIEGMWFDILILAAFFAWKYRAYLLALFHRSRGLRKPRRGSMFDAE